MMASLPRLVLYALVAALSVSQIRAQVDGCPAASEGEKYLPLSAETVVFGYFSKNEPPRLFINSGDEVTVEMGTHTACDDYDMMIAGDEGLESVYDWDSSVKAVSQRGATGEGDGVHILTGPIYVCGAEAGDIIKVEILDLEPRANPAGEIYGSNQAAWWGYQFRAPTADGGMFKAGEFIETPGVNDEFVTVWKIEEGEDGYYASPEYMYEWPTLVDPDGVERDYLSYPGTCVPHTYEGASDVVASRGWNVTSGSLNYTFDLTDVSVPLDIHIGCMGLAPSEVDVVNSIPPMGSNGGNIDSIHIGQGTTMYYKARVPGGLLSMGDAHAAQGDGEVSGTAIEISVTGRFRITVIQQNSEEHELWMANLAFPLGETPTHYVVHGLAVPEYLSELDDPDEIFSVGADVDAAMKTATAQTRDFIVDKFGVAPNEALTAISIAGDFAVTQVVDGNWGVHTMVPKAIFPPYEGLKGWSVPELPELTDFVESTSGCPAPEGPKIIRASPETVHWGYYHKDIPPVLYVNPGDEVVIETITLNGGDDWDRISMGDAATEAIYWWNQTDMPVSKRGARCENVPSTEGDRTPTCEGAHIMTGPVFICGVEPNDTVKVDILDLVPRLNPGQDNRTFGSVVLGNWGYQYRLPKRDGSDWCMGDAFRGRTGCGYSDEFASTWEAYQENGTWIASPLYYYNIANIIDPQGHDDFLGYTHISGLIFPHTYPNSSGAAQDMGWSVMEETPIEYQLDPFPFKVPLNPHIGNLGLASAIDDEITSIPAMGYLGHNLDQKRTAPGTTVYLKAEVEGGLFSAGDAHSTQGDSELTGTAIEHSLTARLRIDVIKDGEKPPELANTDTVIFEKPDEWVISGFTYDNYIYTLGDSPLDAQRKIFNLPGDHLNMAMNNTYINTRDFMMDKWNLTESEAINIMSCAVHFGVTQVVDHNMGMHGRIPKAIFGDGERRSRRLKRKQPARSVPGRTSLRKRS